MTRKDEKLEACYSCSFENAEEAKYCGMCGCKLDNAQKCNTCKSLIPYGGRFCGTCGSLSSSEQKTNNTSNTEEQLRQVTVLFVLFHGLQEIIVNTEVEFLKELLDDCFRVITSEVFLRGGTIDKYMVDSLLVVFGAPLAHEDDAERAVSTALGMQRAMNELNKRIFEQYGFKLELKIGINTGKVLLGYVGGKSHNITVMGDVVNTASRVEQATPPGSILICESTKRNLGNRFHLKEQPPLKVKGKELPLTVFSVLKEESNKISEEKKEGNIPIIGREKEFDILARNWRQVAQRTNIRTQSIEQEAEVEAPQGKWITLIGDVGLGKERLVSEFQRYVNEDPSLPLTHTILRDISSHTSGPEPIKQLISLLYNNIYNDPTNNPSDIDMVSKLSSELDGIDPETSENFRQEMVTSVLSRFLGLSSGFEKEEDILLVNPKRLREQAITYLISICATLSKKRPVLIIAGEMQWMDEVSLDFFEALGKNIPNRLLLLTFTRPFFIERRPKWGHDTENHSIITLQPLDLSSTQRLVRAVLGEDTIQPSLIERLYKFTGGNPFYLIETLKNYLETEKLGKLNKNKEFTVPDSIESVLQSRIDRLSTEEAMVIRAAAVIGITFWESAVASLLDKDIDFVSRILAQITNRGFIRKVENSPIKEEIAYTFDHALIAKVAEGNLLDEAKKQFHLKAALWCQERNNEKTPLNILTAKHFESAGHHHESAWYYMQAGERSLRSYDCESANSLLTLALTNIQTEVSEPDNKKRQLLAQIYAHRGEALRMISNYPLALEDFIQASNFYKSVNNEMGSASTLYRAGLVHLAIGNLASASQALAEGDNALIGSISPFVSALGSQLRAELYIAKGLFSDAKIYLDKALLLWRQIGGRWGLAHCLHNLGILHLHISEQNSANRYAYRAFIESAKLRESLGDMSGLADTLFNLGNVSANIGNIAESIGCYHKCLRLFQRSGNKEATAQTFMRQAIVHGQSGYYGRARASAESSYTLQEDLGDYKSSIISLSILGNIWLQVRMPQKANNYFQMALSTYEREKINDFDMKTELLAHRSLSEIKLGYCDSGIEFAKQAFELSQKASNRTLEAYSLQTLAIAYLEKGMISDAQDCLDELEWSEFSQHQMSVQFRTAIIAGRLAFAQHRYKAAIGRFEEGDAIAKQYDFIPAQWEARYRKYQSLKWIHSRDTDTAKEQMLFIYRELSARIEDKELLQAMDYNLRQVLASAPPKTQLA